MTRMAPAPAALGQFEDWLLARHGRALDAMAAAAPGSLALRRATDQFDLIAKALQLIFDFRVELNLLGGNHGQNQHKL